MTMADGKCEVCGINEPIGVASTLMPLSVAYCAECAQRHAQPEIVFVCWFDNLCRDFDKMADGFADNVETFKDGRYISYREWAKNYEPKT